LNTLSSLVRGEAVAAHQVPDLAAVAVAEEVY
jgi:hypothetical protein